MKSILFTFILMFFCGSLIAQKDGFNPPRLVKSAIENTGCYAYFPENVELEFDVSYSEDSSEVYSGDFLAGDFRYGIILVKLKDANIESSEDKEGLLESYLDYLINSFNIVGSAGYGKGHTLESNPDAVGIIDYWQDADGDKWSIKAWADESTIAVMFIYGEIDYPNYNVQQMYLNGFRFEEQK